MRNTKLVDFTGKDTVKLVVVLYTIKTLYLAVDHVAAPRLRRIHANLEEKNRIKEAQRLMEQKKEKKEQ